MTDDVEGDAVILHPEIEVIVADIHPRREEVTKSFVSPPFIPRPVMMSSGTPFTENTRSMEISPFG